MKQQSAYLHKKEFEIPLYRGKFVVILTNDVSFLQKYIPQFEHKEVYAHSWLINWKGKQGFVMILNFDSNTRKIYHGVITHEALHVVHFIAQCRGMVPDFENDEHLSYLSEWVSDKVYSFARQHNFFPDYI